MLKVFLTRSLSQYPCPVRQTEDRYPQNAWLVVYEDRVPPFVFEVIAIAEIDDSQTRLAFDADSVQFVWRFEEKPRLSTYPLFYFGGGVFWWDINDGLLLG